MGFGGPGGLPMDSERNFDLSWPLETPQSFFWTHFNQFLNNFQHFFGFQPFEIQLFSKKSIPCGRSGQSLLWKMMAYWISLYEVFAPRCRKHKFLPCSLQVFRKNSFSILSHLRAFSPGFCFMLQWYYILGILWTIFLEYYELGKYFLNMKSISGWFFRDQKDAERNFESNRAIFVPRSIF